VRTTSKDSSLTCPTRRTNTGTISIAALPPESIDFLNAVWRVQFKDKLFHLSVATAIVQLSLPCAAVEEFWARISALCDVLDRMRVPESLGQKKEDGSLTRLQLFPLERV